MNYCTKCESYYQKAGTCNCFVEAKQQPATLDWTWTPWWVYPVYREPYWYTDQTISVPTYSDVKIICGNTIDIPSNNITDA